MSSESEKLTILFLGANPIGQRELAISREVEEVRREIQKAAASAEYRRKEFKTEYRLAVTFEELQAALIDVAPDFVHISSHGRAGDFIFADLQGHQRTIAGDAVVSVLSAKNRGYDVRGALLVACESKFTASRLQQQLHFAVGMSEEISDRAARLYAGGFYMGLARNLPSDVCHNLGCERVASASLEEESIPQHYAGPPRAIWPAETAEDSGDVCSEPRKKGGLAVSKGMGESLTLVVDLRGIVKIFGDSLYSDFGAVVRELVQNSHDAIVETCSATAKDEAQLFEQLADYYVRVKYGPESALLVVADNGPGMSRTEIEQNLNNFAFSRKSELRKRMGAQTPVSIIGEYGVGFLSAMAMSSSVRAYSRSMSGGPVLWEYLEGDSDARVRPVTEPHYLERLRVHGLPSTNHGTIIECQLKSNVVEEFQVDTDQIRASLRKYVSLMAVPVYLNLERISTDSRAWRDARNASIADWHEFIEVECCGESLHCIPVEYSDDFIDISGVLWIPPRTALSDRANVRIYSKRLFINTDGGQLIPQWARFVRGVLNSNKLHRMVAGDKVKADSSFRRCKQAIERILVAEIIRLLESTDEEYERTLGEYEDILKQAAVDNESLLQKVWRRIRFRYQGGTVTLPECLRLGGSESVVYYFERPTQKFAAGIASSTTGIPVLSLCDRDDNRLARKAADSFDFHLVEFSELALKKAQQTAEFT